VWTKDPAAERRANISYYVSNADARKQAWRDRVERPMWVAEPNAGHRALADLEQHANLHTLVTQNVDGLHQRAGTSPEIVVEIHGTIHQAKCLDCGWRGPMEETLDRVRAGEEDPPCLECGGMLKSGTISFGENLVPADLLRAQAAAEGADLFLAIGTSLGVYPAAALPEIALRNGAHLAILNAEPTPFDDHASIVVRDQLGMVLPELVTLVRGGEPAGP
jgi:NAD-dependent deacetylase